MSQASTKCFKEIMGFPKITMCVHTRLAAEKTSTRPEFLQAAVNSEEFLKLRGRTRIPLVSKTDEQHFKPGQTEIKNKASR
jgi:hypothetical protein